MTDIRLVKLKPDDREQFITDNQEAFNYGALEEFGMRDDHLEEDGQIISRKTIEQSIDNGTAYRIMKGDEKVGGVVVKVDENKVNWSCYLHPQRYTAKALDKLLGVRLKNYIPK